MDSTTTPARHAAHRLAHRLQEGPVRTADAAAKVHGPGRAGRFNAFLGVKITVIVGTMWCAYAFAAIALISLPDNVQSTQLLILWISSSFLQLVLLPIIIVGQNIQAEAADRRSEQTYKDAEAVLHEALEIQTHLDKQDQALADLLGRLQGATS
jgi:hypothetical protein